MKEKKPTAVGKGLVRRLKRFTTALETTEDISTQFTCRTVKLDLKPRRYSAEMVKETRRGMRVSQAIFAQFLGVSLGTVRDWEQGNKPPNGAASRLMDEIRNNPEYFFKRLMELASPVQ